MKFQKNIFLALLALVIFGTSCQEGASLKDPAISVIPAASSSVTSIDLKRLMDKADSPALQKMDVQ